MTLREGGLLKPSEYRHMGGGGGVGTSFYNLFYARNWLETSCWSWLKTSEYRHLGKGGGLKLLKKRMIFERFLMIFFILKFLLKTYYMAMRTLFQNFYNCIFIANVCWRR